MRKFFRKALKFLIDIFTVGTAIVSFISLGVVNISAWWQFAIFAASWAWLWVYAWAKGWIYHTNGGAEK